MGELIFDTHAHVISADTVRYPPSPDARSKVFPFDAEALIAQMDEGGVTKTCAVQRGRYYGFDNSYCLDSTRRYPDRLTPVVVLDAQDPATPGALRDMLKAQPIGGVRFAADRITQYDTAWMNSPAAMKTWETAAELKIPVAIIFFVRHRPYALPALKLIAELFPDLPIVIDHIGVPHATNFEARWTTEQGLPQPYLGAPDYGIRPEMKDFRPLRNVFFKLTGINFERLEAHHVDPAAFVRRFADEFGADRMMWGSDIGQTEGPYSRLVDEVRQSALLMTDAERRHLFYDTAERIFAAGFGAK
jgi:L-fuconolactonase